MKRNPELAHEISKLPDVAQARHVALDKVTAAHLAVEMLNKDTNAVKELDVEERAIEYMEDAVYAFRKYLRMKLKEYEARLHDLAEEQEELLERGNAKIIEHRNDLNQIAKERGLS